MSDNKVIKLLCKFGELKWVLNDSKSQHIPLTSSLWPNDVKTGTGLYKAEICMFPRLEMFAIIIMMIMMNPSIHLSTIAILSLVQFQVPPSVRVSVMVGCSQWNKIKMMMRTSRRGYNTLVTRIQRLQLTNSLNYGQPIFTWGDTLSSQVRPSHVAKLT